MIVGTTRFKLSIRQSRSLKDKRRILSSLKDYLSQRFNVSVAEVDGQDLIQGAVIGVAQVANDSRYVNASLDRVVETVRRFPAVELVDYETEIL